MHVSVKPQATHVNDADDDVNDDNDDNPKILLLQMAARFIEIDESLMLRQITFYPKCFRVFEK